MSTTTATALTPNRVDARTIRAALKAAGVLVEVRVTSGKHTTYINRLDRDNSLGWTYLTEAEALEVAAALRPLWNDGDRRVYLGTPFESLGERLSGGVNVHRAGWHTTTPLEAELELLSEVLPAGRVAELREDSTRAERIAELDAAAGPRTVLLNGDVELVVLTMRDGTAFRLLEQPITIGASRRPGRLAAVLESAHGGAPFERCTIVGLSPEVRRYELVRDLLLEVDKRRRPIRRPAIVNVHPRTDVI